MKGSGQMIAEGGYLLLRDGESFPGSGRGRSGDLEVQKHHPPRRTDSSLVCCQHGCSVETLQLIQESSGMQDLHAGETPHII